MLQHRNNAFQLGLLTAIHFSVDMLTGTLPGILPLLMTKYNFSIGAGAMLLTLMSLSSNAVQMWAGALRKNSHRPLLIPLGLALTGAISFIGLVPSGGAAIWLLVVLVLAVGVGTALVHPEGLRAVCAVDPGAVEPQTATPVFMTAGFFGFASGAFFSGALAQLGGLYGMLFLLLPVVVLLWLFMRSHVVVSADRGGNVSKRKCAVDAGASKIGFWSIFWICVCINSGCSIMQGLLPTLLKTGGHSLAFGGFSAMLFGAGAGIGALFVGGVLCRRFPVCRVLQIEMTAGLPFLCIYLLGCTGDGAWWVLLLPPAGFLLGSGFPQLVVLARGAHTARPMAVGVRMGVLVGGSWAVAGLVLLGVGQAADLIGLPAAIWSGVLCFAPVVPAMFLLNKKMRSPA